MPRREPLSVVESSFLRGADARTKLALSLAASVAVMLPLRPLGVFFIGYMGLVVAARATMHTLTQLRRIALLLCVLFAVDWLFLDLEFAVLISLRLMLLATAFSLFLATTTPEELRVALERLFVPPRLAFVFATAYSTLGLLETEWRGIIEAQQARGIWAAQPGVRGWRAWRQHLASMVSLLVPAIVLVTQRAWSLSEAAAVRGFESPHRRVGCARRLGLLDGALLAGTALVLVGLLATR